MDAALTIRSFIESDRHDLIALWSECGLTRSWNDPNKDIDRKVAHSPEGLLVAYSDDELVGSVMVGYDGHRGWVNYLATAASARRAGIGRVLMDAAEANLLEAGCPKLNLQIRTSNDAVVEFYGRLDYAQDDVLSMGKRLIADD